MNNKELRLPLKTKWFEMTKAEIKREDYRSITPYWCSRLLLHKCEKKSEQFWENEFFKVECETAENLLIKYLRRGIISFNPFYYNTMTKGYPPSSDTEKILKLEHKGIEIRTGKIEWGAEKYVLYFVIKHGKINRNN